MKDLMILFGGVFVGLSLITFGVDSLMSRECKIFSDVTGKQTKRQFFSECYIEHEGEWLLYEIYKARSVALDGLDG